MKKKSIIETFYVLKHDEHHANGEINLHAVFAAIWQIKTESSGGPEVGDMLWTWSWFLPGVCWEIYSRA